MAHISGPEIDQSRILLSWMIASEADHGEMGSGGFQNCPHIRQLEWLVEHAQKIEVQFLHQLLGLIQAPVIAAHHDNGGFHVLPAKLLEDLNAADLGHYHIDKNDIIVPDFIGVAGR